MDEKLQDFEAKRAAREKQYEADKQTARLEKEEAERRAAEQEQEIDKARSETEEANNDKYAAQLAMILTLLKEDKERDQEYQSAILLAQKKKNDELLVSTRSSTGTGAGKGAGTGSGAGVAAAAATAGLLQQSGCAKCHHHHGSCGWRNSGFDRSYQ